MATPTLLIIGHLCHDRMPSGAIKLGGTAAYAAFLAKKMGAEITILTSVGDDFAFYDLFEKEGISIFNISAKETTVFENIYPEDGSERIQYLHARAATILTKDIPNDLMVPDMVLFCPIADEVDLGLLEYFPDSLKMATIQGWLRDWNEEGLVAPKVMNWEGLAPLDLLVFSDADIVGFENSISVISDIVPIVIMTRGWNGVRVFEGNKTRNFPTEPIEVKDATGAGDSFAMAFLLKYFKTKEIKAAVDYGQKVAREVIGGFFDVWIF